MLLRNDDLYLWSNFPAFCTPCGLSGETYSCYLPTNCVNSASPVAKRSILSKAFLSAKILSEEGGSLIPFGMRFGPYRLRGIIYVHKDTQNTRIVQVYETVTSVCVHGCDKILTHQH